MKAAMLAMQAAGDMGCHLGRRRGRPRGLVWRQMTQLTGVPTAADHCVRQGRHAKSRLPQTLQADALPNSGSKHMQHSWKRSSDIFAGRWMSFIA